RSHILSEARTRKKQRALLCEKKGIKWRHGATGTAKQHHISPWPQYVEALFEGCFTNGVIHHMHPLVVGDLFGFFLEVAFVVKDPMMRASLPRQFRLFFR